MPDPRSEWSLTASCSTCRGAFSIASTAVLLRRTYFGPRGVMLDVLGERWPEAGLLFHSRCFAQRSGRRSLWTSFLRGRFDKGVSGADRSRADGRVGDVVVTDADWSLSVSCCVCSTPVDAEGPAVVRDEQRWRWLPVLQERRPGQRRVYHLRCFVNSHGQAAAYALLGLDLWDRVPPVVKKIGGAISPLP